MCQHEHHRISVFLENRTGQLAEIAHLMAQNGVVFTNALQRTDMIHASLQEKILKSKQREAFASCS